MSDKHGSEDGSRVPGTPTPCLVAWQHYKPVAVKQGISQRKKERW